MKKYIVTGASSGIGKECTRMLLNQGNQVIMVARTKPSFSNIRKNKESIFIDSDFSIPGSGELLIDYLGNNNLLPINGLIHCAGIAPLLKISENLPDKVKRGYEVNLFSFMEIMNALEWGGLEQLASIVVMSSVVSVRGSNRQSLYAGTKAALEETVRYYSGKLSSYGIRVNAIVSGAVQTEMLQKLEEESLGLEKRMKNYYPLGVIGVNEICNLIGFFLSEKSYLFNGKSIPVDSGYLL